MAHRNMQINQIEKSGKICYYKSSEEPNPDRFSAAAFRQYCGKTLENTGQVILLVLPKSGMLKTAQHPTARIFALDFCADDESLLTQAEEDKEKDK